MIQLALTKGRLEQNTAAMLEALGYDCGALYDKGRKLILPVGDSLQVVLAKSADVITYVDSGVCDMGVVGKDTITEMGGSFYEVADLGFGCCRFALATLAGKDFYSGYRAKRIATKYPSIAGQFFANKGIDVNIVRIEGSVELAPILGLADGIVDLVETGATLRENGLVVTEYFLDVSARLIVNIASLKLKKQELERIIDQIEGYVRCGRDSN